MLSFCWVNQLPHEVVLLIFWIAWLFLCYVVIRLLGKLVTCCFVFSVCWINQLSLVLSDCWVNQFPPLSNCQSAG
jgi:hypothetical protein